MRFAQPRWYPATVDSLRVETASVKTLNLKVVDFPTFRPGQHVDVRLSAPDGYQAQRSYSLSSPPAQLVAGGGLSITVEHLAGGEVSPYLHNSIQVGDKLEVLGPIGMPFSWDCDQGGPLALIAGGSGIAPLMSIVRHLRSACPSTAVALLYSVRSYADLIYRRELGDLSVPKVLTLTRAQTARPGFHNRRIDGAMIGQLLSQLPSLPKHTYICGSTPFVESVADLTRACTLPDETIHTERFGG